MEWLVILGYILAVASFVLIFDFRRKRTTRPEAVPAEPEGEVVERFFSWNWKGHSGNIPLNTTVRVRKEQYISARGELLKDKPSKILFYSDSEYFDVASIEAMHSDFGSPGYEISQVAVYLQNVADQGLLSDFELAGIILGFTQEQCIKYDYDKDTTGYNEYLRFPIETIHDKTGDCDCKAVLACSLYKRLGFRVAFAVMPGHAAVAITLPGDYMPFANFVMGGQRWYYCETTGEHWHPGQLPDGIDPDMVKLVEI